MSFRDNLLHLRASANMTQEQLAMLLGVSRQSVTKWESERTYPEMDKLLKMCRIFDCSLDDLVQGDLTGTEARTSTSAAPSAPPADLFDYDATMRRFAQRISNGVMAIIMGVGLGTLFLNEEADFRLWATLTENTVMALGLLCIFLGVIAGLALIVPTTMEHSAFVKAHPFIEDFYTAEEKSRARATFTYELIGGIGAICIGACLAVLFDSTPYEETLAVPLLLLFVAVGVRFIVHGGITLGRTNLDEYNHEAGEVLSSEEIESADVSDEQRQKMLADRRVHQRVSTLCGIIMIAATIVAFLMLFLSLASTGPDQAPRPNILFWLPWPIGGMLCLFASLIAKARAER